MEKKKIIKSPEGNYKKKNVPKMLAIRAHLYILGDTKACSNSSNEFFLEKYRNAYTILCFQESCCFFCLFVHSLLFKTIYCIGYYKHMLK